MRHRGVLVAVMVLLAVGALLFRLPSLDNRPMHGDEAVHAFKFLDLWQKGDYRYDPNEYHGPTIYYAELPVVWLTGRKSFVDIREADYRLPTVLFGAAMLLLLIPLSDALGRRGTVCAGLMLAISPAFVFYSRYYIQEILLTFFTLGMLACGWRYTRCLRPIWLVGAGVCAGLMVATKETAVVTFVACGLGVVLTALWTKHIDGTKLDLRRFSNPKLFAITGGVALFTACLLLTGLFRHPSAAIDYLRSYTPWLGRAHGTSLHRHPWSYYLEILVWWKKGSAHVWSEGLIVGLALIGGIAAALPNKIGKLKCSLPFARFIAFATLLLTAIYSIIPYKTPWCVLSFLLGMILLAGIGASVLLERLPGNILKSAVAVLLLAAFAQLGWQSHRTSYVSYMDSANPYVYAQPVADVVELGRRLEKLSLASTEHNAMVVKVFAKDQYYWPLPWYLREFPNVGFYQGVPEDAQAAIVLADPDFDEQLDKKLGPTHLMNHIYGLRPGAFFEIWIRMDVWKAYLDWKKTQPQPKEEAESG